MREDQSGKPGKEELVSKYFSEEMEHSGQAGLSQPANFAKNKVYRNILGAIGQGKSGVWRLPLRWPVAASLGALICLSLLGYRYRDSILHVLQPNRLVVTETGLGEVRNLTLDDGTQIWLNAASRLTYPVSFSGDRREVSLEGEAYFDVAHDEQRPFIVHADRVSTRVLGTRFNISAYKDERDITVSVVQGKVGVSTITDVGADTSNTLLVLPNQRVIYHKATRLLSRDEYHNVENPDSWKEGILVYRKTHLTEIVADLQRAYHVRIKTSKGVGGCEISADFINDSLTKVLRILAELVNGELIEEDGNYLLTGEGCGQQP